jgi:signal peptidase II
MKARVVRTLGIILLIAANISCDQVSKSIAREELSYGEQTEVVGRMLMLTKVENKGAFLGMGSNLPDWLKNILLLGLPGLVMIGIFVFLMIKTEFTKTTVIGLSFIVGGGIGNLYDRILYGEVTDFLHMDFGGVFRTGIFNMADVSVMVGTGLILLESFKKKKPEENVVADATEV